MKKIIDLKEMFNSHNLKKITPYRIKKGGQKTIVSLLRFALMFGLTYIFLFPILYIFTVSFQTTASANDPSVVWIPKELTLENFKATMEVLEYSSSLALSFQIAVFSTIAVLVSCSLAGYGLARFKFKEKNLIFALVVLTIIIPSQATMIPSYLNFRFFDFGGILKLLSPIIGIDSVNLLETPWVFILPAMFANGVRCGLYIFIFRQFFIGLPAELEEAAMIDGCGVLKTYVRIMVPMAVPCFVTVLMFSFIWHWNDLYGSIMYFGSGARPINAMLDSLSQLLRQANLYIGNTDPQQIRTYLAAASLLTIWPPLLLYTFFQRFFREGIAKTGIVG